MAAATGPTHLALCSGIGGISLGLRRAVDARDVGHVERDAYCQTVLLARMEDASLDPAPVFSDLEDFCGLAWRGGVDILSAGFPCQPFSSAGQQRGLLDERWLWPLVERAIRDVEPGYVFLENVPGLIRHGLGVVLGGLADIGFDAEWGVFSAAGSGAPHIRKRFFLLAAHPDRYSQPDGPLDAEAQGLQEPIGGDRWATESPVPTVDDGFPTRMDQCRALGNAVVPAVAERAFRVLYGRLIV